MPVKLQTAKRKQELKSFPHQKLRRDYHSDLNAIPDLAARMRKIADENSKYTLMTQIAKELKYSYDELYKLAQDHPEIKEAYDYCKYQMGLNAYQGIEDRSLTGVFSKYSVSKYVKEVRDERDAIKAKEHAQEIEKIVARKEAQKEQYQEIITEIREKNGKKVAVVSVNENILLPDEE